MRRFWNDEGGVTSIEYALIATIVSLSLIAGTTVAGGTLVGFFGSVRDGFASR